MVPVGVLHLEPADCHSPDEVSVPGFHEVGVGLERDLRPLPLVQFEGVEVGVTHVCVEVICRVVGFSGQVEQSLEYEVEVGVVADYPAVEGVLAVGAHGPDPGVGISQRLQLADAQRIYPDLGASRLERGLEGGFEGDLADFIDSAIRGSFFHQFFQVQIIVVP